MESIIVWIIINVFGIFSINCKVYMFKAWHKSKKKFMLKALKPWEWMIIGFFKCPFFLPNVHYSFSKLKRIFTLMIRRAKGFELMKIIFIIHLNTFGSKVFLTLKIMDFESVVLTKVVHIYVIDGMNAYCTWYRINL